MGKKNFFKFPSKKTMEYILIGILFVAVLSCTMKMIKMIKMNGSFIEGFGAATADADVCGTVGTPSELTCEINSTDSIGTYGSYQYQTIKVELVNEIYIGKNMITLYNTARELILINLDTSLTDITATQLLTVSETYKGSDPSFYLLTDNASIAGTLDITDTTVYARQVLKDGVKSIEIITKSATSNTDATTIRTFMGSSGIGSTLIHLDSISNSGAVYTMTVSGGRNYPVTISDSTCEEIYAVEGTTIPTPGSVFTAADCQDSTLPTCLTFTDADTSPCSGPNSLGCQSEAGDATDGSVDCLCGDGIGDGGEMKFYEEGSSWPYSYPTDPNSADGTQITGLTLEDTESCLKSAIDQSKNSATNNADLCHPRWPCISSMNDYLEILNTPLIAPAGNPTADVCNKTVTGDDLDNQNKIPISLCVPYDNADGNDSDCYGLHTIGECESVQNDDDDSTNKKCVWNPYCQMPNNGRDNLGNETSEGTRDAGGSETSDGTRTSKVYTDMLTCIKSGNIWDLPMMEELNDKRDDDNKIIFPDGIEHYTNTTEFGYDAIKSAMRGNGLGCHVEGNGGALMCAVSSSAYNSADRLYGQCPGELEHSPCIQDEDIPDSGDQGACTYCRTTNTNSTVVDSTVKTIQDVDPTGATTFLTDTFGITPSGDITDCVNIYHI